MAGLIRQRLMTAAIIAEVIVVFILMWAAICAFIYGMFWLLMML